MYTTPDVVNRERACARAGFVRWLVAATNAPRHKAELKQPQRKDSGSFLCTKCYTTLRANTQPCWLLVLHDPSAKVNIQQVFCVELWRFSECHSMMRVSCECVSVFDCGTRGRSFIYIPNCNCRHTNQQHNTSPHLIIIIAQLGNTQHNTDSGTSTESVIIIKRRLCLRHTVNKYGYNLTCGLWRTAGFLRWKRLCYTYYERKCVESVCLQRNTRSLINVDRRLNFHLFHSQHCGPHYAIVIHFFRAAYARTCPVMFSQRATERAELYTFRYNDTNGSVMCYMLYIGCHQSTRAT